MNSQSVPRALTTKYPGRTNVLTCMIRVTAAFDPQTQNPNEVPHVELDAIWDTGATASVVSRNVVRKLKLEPTGRKDVHTANGVAQQNTYSVAIGLPSGVYFPFLSVTEADLTTGSDALIGMDIISLGDFSVTCANGKTILSFRVPSQEEIDYVREAHLAMGIGRSQRRRIEKEQIKQQKKRKLQ